MLTKETIINEINELPAGRLGDVYEFIHAINVAKEKKEKKKKKILSYSGILSDMPAKDYADFRKHTAQTRTELFTRKINL